MARLSAFLLSEQSCPFCPIFPIILKSRKTRHAREVIGCSSAGVSMIKKLKTRRWH